MTERIMSTKSTLAIARNATVPIGPTTVLDEQTWEHMLKVVFDDYMVATPSWVNNDVLTAPEDSSPLVLVSMISRVFSICGAALILELGKKHTSAEILTAIDGDDKLREQLFDCLECRPAEFLDISGEKAGRLLGVFRQVLERLEALRTREEG